ncbi:MAG: beta-N-acetylhexosaminidase [Rhodocyclales bacterium]|nr:beta-N-acetylhexosaminidase [Rhodocyclales bacterium]
MHSPKQLPLGPLMIDIAGTGLTDLDRERLSHPSVGGIILFARNYASPEQLARLCGEIHVLRTPPLPIGIDHEGGRVQRCREGFTRLPAMRSLGEAWDADPARAKEMARAIGYVLAAELRAHGVDLSFTPVLDLDWGRSTVVGTRAFHRDPEVVAALAGELIVGLRQAGMIACGKHFPGHGWVEADSHVAIPVDERGLDELAADMLPYRKLELDAVMPAHVSFPKVDSKSAGFSNYWISFLRNDIKFGGVIFSDDLSMEGASVAGDVLARATAAYRAGCDMLLVCNAPEAVGELLQRWHEPLDPQRSARIAGLLPTRPAPTRAALQDDPLYRAGVAYAGALVAAA